MISPLSFKGVKIGTEMRYAIPKKRKESEPIGFYQVVNFLDAQEGFDFKIKKPLPLNAQVDTYDKETGEKKASVRIPVRKFATNPEAVIGAIGKSIYSGKEIGKALFIDKFVHSDKSADSTATLNAGPCNDYMDGFYSDSKGMRFI